jgi:hypothetical protein
LLVAYNGTADAKQTLSVSITGTGLGTAPANFRGTPQGPLAARMMLADRAEGADGLVPDESFHVRLQESSRKLVPGRLAGARAWYAARSRRPSPTTLGSFNVAPSYAAIPANPRVGDLLRVNVNAIEGCTSPTYRAARVAAIGTTSIVLADTTNPRGGFTDADYQRIAARFDTLVYPLDVNTFGAPTDIDGNGRVAILFTRAVNELTRPNSDQYVGGFFYARDLFPLNATPRFPACAGSNEGEMFYMLVPDPTGVVNGNVRRTGFVDTLTTGVLAHELQHLINAARRLYVNLDAIDLEEVWLNEGLSHIAEELLYYRESGKQPRQNLTDASIRVNSPETYRFWRADAAPNFSRYMQYLRNPEQNSPVADDDSLATRGATWSFLRYAVDQLFASDAGVWTRFGNSTSTGFGTLTFGLRTDAVPLLRNWAMAIYLDDTGFSPDDRYQQRSWNFRDIYANTFINLGWPLKVTPLVNGAASTATIRGRTAAYFRLTVPAGQEVRLTFSSGGAAPSAKMEFIAVRTR